MSACMPRSQTSNDALQWFARFKQQCVANAQQLFVAVFVANMRRHPFQNWQLRARVAGLFVGVLFRSSGHGRWAGHGKTVPMSRTDHEGIQAIPYATNRKPVHANATRSRFRLSLPHLTLTVSAKAGSERCLGDVFACKTFY